MIVHHKNTILRRRFEAHSEYTMSEKLDMRFQTYCGSVLGISLPALMSNSSLRTISGGMLAYMKQAMQLCDFGNTYEDMRKCFSQGSPKKLDETDMSAFDKLVDILDKHFERFSGGVFQLKVRKGGKVREFPMGIQIIFSLEDGGTTLWSDSLNLPLYICFVPQGSLRLMSDEAVQDRVRSEIQDEIERLSDEWDDARRSIDVGIRSEFEKRSVRKEIASVPKGPKAFQQMETELVRAGFDRMRTALLNLESRRVRRSRKNEATDSAVNASVAHSSLVNLFSSKSVNSSWVRCATPKELKSTTWWNDFKAAINDISSMPGVTVEYRSENGAKTFAQFQKVVKSCANRYKYDDYELQLEQDYSNDRIFISGGLASKLSWDEIIISFK